MSSDLQNNVDPYADIRPYDDSNLHEKIKSLVVEPGFEHAIKFVMPNVNYEDFVKKMLSVKDQDDFQKEIVGSFLELLAAKTTHGLSMSGTLDYAKYGSFTFITNHRDIVLDAAFLNLCMIRRNEPFTQVAIGNNLLIYDWITDLVKLNRSFIVKRDTGVREALEAAKQLSGYIHEVIAKKHDSVWIAQREGRAKDSNDRTQESLVKMLSLTPGRNVKENILSLNINPISISYEFDPNDYLKVREFLLKRRDPEFKKSKRDDLFSMETGILKQKGRVHFQVGACINPCLEAYPEEGRAEVIHRACELIDHEIHAGYRIYPCNYIAYDELHGTKEYANEYTADDFASFREYIKEQLEKVDVPDITEEEYQYMQAMMYTMYANPLMNKRSASPCE